VSGSLREPPSEKSAEAVREGHTEDALASSADEGRGTLRKAPVRCVQPLEAGDVRMGKPSRSHVRERESEGTG
jgi:hypothetical protein